MAVQPRTRHRFRCFPNGLMIYSCVWCISWIFTKAEVWTQTKTNEHKNTGQCLWKCHLKHICQFVQAWLRWYYPTCEGLFMRGGMTSNETHVADIGTCWEVFHVWIWKNCFQIKSSWYCGVSLTHRTCVKYSNAIAQSPGWGIGDVCKLKVWCIF